MDLFSKCLLGCTFRACANILKERVVHTAPSRFHKDVLVYSSDRELDVLVV